MNEGSRRRRRLGGAGRVWLLNAILAAVGAALFLGPVSGLRGPEPPFAIPWVFLAAGFALAEVLVVHVEFRRNAYQFSFNEIPLVVALFFLPPAHLVLAQLAASLVVLALVHRQSFIKLGFNLGLFGLQGALGLLVFHALLGPGAGLEPRAAAAAFAATAVGTIVADLLIGLAIRLSGERVPLRQGLLMLAVGLAGTVGNSALAVLTVVILVAVPWASVVLLVPAATIWAAYRAYTSQRQRREQMEFLLGATRILEQHRTDQALVELLGHCRATFRAEIAEVVLLPQDDGGGHARSSVGVGERVEAMVPLRGEERIAFDDLVRAGEPVLVRRTPGDAYPAYVRMRGIEDAIVAPLEGETRLIGAIVVANRLGDVTSFDREDLRLLSTLASHAAMALENGRLERMVEHMTEVERERLRLLDEVVQAAEEERTRLSAELHDGPVQRLSALGFSLDRLRLRLDRTDVEGAVGILERTQQRLSEEVEGLRALMAELRPPILDERGLAAALVGYAADFELETGIAVRVQGEAVGRIPPSHETVLYRMVQEALSNVRKHAEATSVLVDFRPEERSVRLEVRDDGVGFEPTPGALGIGSKNHYGLSIMRERVELAGGRWELRSRLGEGTTIVARLPLHEVAGPADGGRVAEPAAGRARGPEARAAGAVQDVAAAGNAAARSSEELSHAGV